MLHFKDISEALFVGLQASSKYRYFSQSLQNRCMALTSLISPEEVVHLNISYKWAWYFCVKVSLGHIYFFQYLLRKLYSYVKGAWKVSHNIAQGVEPASLPLSTAPLIWEPTFSRLLFQESVTLINLKLILGCFILHCKVPGSPRELPHDDFHLRWVHFSWARQPSQRLLFMQCYHQPSHRKIIKNAALAHKNFNSEKPQ